MGPPSPLAQSRTDPNGCAPASGTFKGGPKNGSAPLFGLIPELVDTPFDLIPELVYLIPELVYIISELVCLIPELVYRIPDLSFIPELVWSYS